MNDMVFRKLYSGGIVLLFLVLTASTNPSFDWEDATPEQAGMAKPVLEQAQDYALIGSGSGCVIRGGKRVMFWGDQKKRYDIKSSTKSIGVTALGLAIKDGIMNLDDKAQQHYGDLGVPPNEGDERLADITIKHLAAIMSSIPSCCTLSSQSLTTRRKATLTVSDR